MLEQLKIENFRCFKSFKLNHLGRVNLLVGENNCGKTSILEAIQLFFSKIDFQSLESIMLNRGEYILGTEYLDASHIFNRHEIEIGKFFLISGTSHIGKIENVKVSIVKLPKEIEDFLNKAIKFLESDQPILKTEFGEYKKTLEQEMLQHQINISKHHKTYFIVSEGQLFSKDPGINFTPLRLIIEADNEKLKTNFVNSSSLSAQKSLELFNQVVLTPEEDLVYQALQIIEPNIERIAPIGNEIKNNNSRSGFFVRLKDTQKRIPIGSMGDGIWRMLGLSLALVSAKDGVLLVDEIDTGLHYTALEDMWKLIWETSKKLNVQVFATTHNSDCWKALEALTSRKDVAEEDISIQRIEKDAPRSVAYNKEEIANAVEREIEVR